MVVIVHILIALSSVGYTSYLFFRPSSAGLRIAYALIAATLATGTYLVWLKPGHLMQSCTMGLIYIGLVTAGILAARKKLASSDANL